MVSARLTIDPRFAIGTVERRLFGAFVEHLGRCVYNGLYEPGHELADEHGFRRDVVELVREFGLHEFADWLEQVGSEPMLAVNLGTRGTAEALDLLEYANIPGGTARSEQRIANGRTAPFDIRMWCLGNEMDGPWQLGHRTADAYGAIASQTAKALRQLDPGLELVVCGSSSAQMPTFGEWERVVLSHTYDDVDYISCHAYYQEKDGDTALPRVSRRHGPLHLLSRCHG